MVRSFILALILMLFCSTVQAEMTLQWGLGTRVTETGFLKLTPDSMTTTYFYWQGGHGIIDMSSGILYLPAKITATSITTTYSYTDIIASMSGGGVTVTENFTVDTDVFHVDADNNRVGIGTTSPQRLLHLDGGANSYARFDTNIGGKSNWAIGADAYGFVIFEEGIGYGLVVNTGGNVGIGTTSPGRLLHVEGDSEWSAWKYWNAGTPGTYTFAVGRTNNADYTGVGEAYTILRNSGGFSTAFLIDQDTGNVGIGTTEPSQKLDVAGAIKASGAIYGNRADRFAFYTISGGIYAAGLVDNYLAGNVGIGTTSPSVKLEVIGAISSTSATQTYSYADYIGSKSGGGVTVTENLTITGNVTANNINDTNWDGAYGWGDHSGEGYITEVTEGYLGKDIDASEMADADHGDVSWSGGVATVEGYVPVGGITNNYWKVSSGIIHTDNYVEGHGDGGNCNAGEYPLGVDASGAVENCTDATTEINTEIGNVLDGTDTFTDFTGTVLDSDNYINGSVDEIHTSFRIAAGTDPDVSTEGDDSLDTDDDTHRGYSAYRSAQFAYGQITKTISFHIENPDDLETGTGRADEWVCVWCNDTGLIFNIVKINGWSDSDNYDFELYETDGAIDFSQANDTLLDLVECDENSTGVFTDEETSFTDSTVDNGDCILFVHKAGETKKVGVRITGYLDADMP